MECIDGTSNNVVFTTKIKLGFKGKFQQPLFMITEEYYENNELVFAKVLFQI